MSSYNIYDEKFYSETKRNALASPDDLMIKRTAIREYKKVTASSGRKIIEYTGLRRGMLFNINMLKDKLEEHKADNEYCKFLICLFEEYNDNRAYKERRISVRPVKKYRSRKKRVNSYLPQIYKEFKDYKGLFTKEPEKFKCMRKAVITYRIIIRTLFTKKIPNIISIELYEDCCKIDKSFAELYDCNERCANITKKGKIFKKASNEGLINNISEDIIWLFIFDRLRFFNLIP